MKTSRFLAAGAALGGLVACQQVEGRSLVRLLTDGSRLDACMPVVRVTGQPVPMPDEVLY